MKNKFLSSIKPVADAEADDTFAPVDNQLSADEADSDEERNYSKLADDISKLDPKKKKELKWKATRFEANKDINEFNISKESNQLNISDLLRNVKDSSAGVKKLRHWNKKRLLETPLEKPEALKVKRAVNYEVTSKEVAKWQPVVEANRNASHLEFPLNQQSLALEPATKVMKRVEPKTKLEREVSELLNKSSNNMTDNKALTEAEEKILKAMSLEEARLRHKELQRMRALLSYQEMKLKRQAKIKSKRYHRILKRERMKNSLKEFEEKQKSDPQAAIDKLKELDKLRALERASLKHKNTGKWAKHLKLRTKYDESARIALAEQLQISQQLLQRKANPESDEENKDEDESDEHQDNESNAKKDNEFVPVGDDYNPWIRKRKDNASNEEEREEAPIINETHGGGINQDDITMNDQIDNFLSQAKELSQTDGKLKNENEVKSKTHTNAQIDPNDFISVKAQKIKSSFPDVITELDSDAESIAESEGISDDEQRKLVSEAFADDDVMLDFKKEKLEKIDAEKEKDLNLHLPGWGQWGGTGIKESKRKIRKFTIKGKNKPRKDSKLGNVILSEKRDETISKYRVKSLPFPFKNVNEFEKSIAQPIGRTWNPEIAFKELTEPKVVTKMGTIINPIDKDALPPKKNSRTRFTQKIRKNKKSKDKETNK